MKYFVYLLFTATAGLCPGGDGTPAEQVQGAVKRLAAAPGYSWVITTKSGDPRFAPGPMEGQTEKGGATRWVMSFGDHKVEAYIKSGSKAGCGKVAVKSGENWVKPEEIKPLPPPPGTPPPGPPPDGPAPQPQGEKHAPPAKGGPCGPEERGRADDHGRPDDRGRPKEGRRTSFLARRLQEMKPPAEVAAELSGKISTFTTSGETFSGELPVEAARDLLGFGHHRSGHGHNPPEPTNPRGTVAFTLNKDGALTRMELHLTATMSFNGSDVAIDRTAQFEIKETTAKLDIPAGARSILDTAAP